MSHPVSHAACFIRLARPMCFFLIAEFIVFLWECGLARSPRSWPSNGDIDLGKCASPPLISNRHNGKFMRRQVVSWASLVKWNSPANWAGSPQLNRPLYVTHPRFQTSLQGCPLLLCSQKVQFLATWMHLWWDLPDGMSETPFCYFVS